MPTNIKAKKHFNPKPEDHPRMSEALDVSTVQTSHVCNNRHPDTCRNPACLLIGGPAGACPKFVVEGWCQHQNNFDLHGKKNDALRPCDATWHGWLFINPDPTTDDPSHPDNRPDMNRAIGRVDGGTWHAVKDFGTPPKSLGITRKDADADAKTRSVAHKQEEEGKVTVATGQFFTRVHLGGGVGMKSDCAKAMEEGRTLDMRELSREGGDIQARLLGSKEMVASGRNQMKKAQSILRR